MISKMEEFFKDKSVNYFLFSRSAEADDTLDE